MSDATGTLPTGETDFDGRPLAQVLMDVERRYIAAVMNAAGGNSAEAARLAGMTYATFRRKLATLDLRVTYHAA